MSEKGYNKSWIFCDVCENVIHKAGSVFPECRHDWRPNSPAGVLKNQKRELGLLGGSERALFEACVRTYQSPIELFYLAEFVRRTVKRAPDGLTILEIGSYHGGTADFFKRYFFPKDIICIDINFEHWLAPENTAIQIEGDTRDARTLETVNIYLNNAPIDLLFIDGDHSIDGARNDWAKYSPLVRDGGVIAFHDTGAIPEVKKVFDEVSGSYKINIVSYQGIGIVVK